MWPDLANFRHWGKIFKVFGNFWRVDLIFGKILKGFGNFWRVDLVFGIVLNLLWLKIMIIVKFSCKKAKILKKQSSHLVTLNLMFSYCETGWLRRVFGRGKAADVGERSVNLGGNIVHTHGTIVCEGFF